MSAPTCSSNRSSSAIERKGDLDVQLVGELGPHTSCRLARRAGAERVALEQDDIGDAELGQVPGRARAHGASTDHYHLGGVDRHGAHSASPPELSIGLGRLGRARWACVLESSPRLGAFSSPARRASSAAT